jgi:hypothetical protein
VSGTLSAPPPKCDFDLSAFRAVDREWKRRTLYLQAGGALVLALLGAIFLASLIERVVRGDLMTFSAGAVFVALFWLLTFVAVMEVQGWFAGATAIRVEEVGVHLWYPRGTREYWSWTSRRTPFIVYQFDPASDWARMGVTYRLDRPRSILALGRAHRRSFISEAAASVLLSTAQRHGMRVKVGRGRGSGFGSGTIMYTVSAGVRTSQKFSRLP